MKAMILGCGNSTGVPATGNYWGACDPANPKNRRTRSSLAVMSGTTSLVIDTGPDFKEQFNVCGLTHLDAVLYTHTHSDHVNGIDDLRILAFRQKKLIPIYGSPETIAEIERRFDYLFSSPFEIYKPIVEAAVIKDEQNGRTQKIGDIEFIPFVQEHGTCLTTGYRFGKLAYSVDMLELDERGIDVLQGIDTWIVDAAAYNDGNNKVHACLETIYRLNDRIQARRVILSSLSLAMDYDSLAAALPKGYEPAYDGLTLDFTTGNHSD